MTWVRRNLFPNTPNAVLTVVFALLVGFAAVKALGFVFFTGRWEVIRVNLVTLLVGLFPREALWRPWVALFILAAAAGFGAGLAATRGTRVNAIDGLRRTWPVLLLLVALVGLRPSLATAVRTAGLPAAFLVAWLAGRRLRATKVTWALTAASVAAAYGVLVFGERLSPDDWGGLLLTAFLAASGIVLSFPFGVLLALGRRSALPGVRVVCVGYIELVRGVPLVTLLFMGAFVIGFLYPPGSSRPDLVFRALIAIVAFTAAYVAEIVRGGLQSLPRGQTEAAQALALSPVATTGYIVLPQALRAVIPALVGQFISLFKDTSLVAIIGLSDLLRVAQTVTSQGRFLAQGLQAETLVFASFIYWVGSYTMSRESQRLERRLGVGNR